MGVWAQPALPASEYFGALSYGAFLMSFGITVVGFAKASTDRPDWVYRLCAVVMCLMSCGVAYAAQYLHVETTSHGYTYDLLVWLHMVVSVSVAAALLHDLLYEAGNDNANTTRHPFALPALLATGVVAVSCLVYRGWARASTRTRTHHGVRLPARSA